MSEVGKINPEMSSDEMEYFIYKQCKEIVKNKITYQKFLNFDNHTDFFIAEKKKYIDYLSLMVDVTSYKNLSFIEKTRLKTLLKKDYMDLNKINDFLYHYQNIINHPKLIISDEALDFMNTCEGKKYLKILDDKELILKVSQFNAFIEKNIDEIILKQLIVTNEQFNQILDRIFQRDALEPLQIKNLKEMLENHHYLLKKNQIDNFRESLYSLVFKEFVQNDVPFLFKVFTAPFVNENEINRLFSSLKYQTNSQFERMWKKKLSTNSGGVRSIDGFCYINLKYAVNSLNLSEHYETTLENPNIKFTQMMIVHEFFHLLSGIGLGVEITNDETGELLGDFNGFNESVTQFLTEEMLNLKMGNKVDYYLGVDIVRVLVENEIIPLSVLKEAYFKNDFYLIQNQIALYDYDLVTFLNLFDKVTFNKDERAYEELKNIVNNIILAKENRSI